MNESTSPKSPLSSLTKERKRKRWTKGGANSTWNPPQTVCTDTQPQLVWIHRFHSLECHPLQGKVCGEDSKDFVTPAQALEAGNRQALGTKALIKVRSRSIPLPLWQCPLGRQMLLPSHKLPPFYAQITTTTKSLLQESAPQSQQLQNILVWKHQRGKFHLCSPAHGRFVRKWDLASGIFPTLFTSAACYVEVTPLCPIQGQGWEGEVIPPVHQHLFFLPLQAQSCASRGRKENKGMASHSEA